MNSASNASFAASAYANAPWVGETAPPTYETDKVAERLNNILNTLASLRVTAGQAADRIFGQEPCMANAGKDNPLRNGALGRLSDTCDQIETTLSDLAGELSRLDRI